MITAIFLSLMLATSITSASWPHKNRIPQGRIIGGEEVSIKYYPYQVAISNYGAHRCGGSIIGENVIITAAHCIKGFVFQGIKVHVGSSYKEKGEIIGIKTMRTHKLYNKTTSDYDIGVIILEKNLTFGPTIQPIPIATTKPEDDEDGIVSGWGRTVEGGFGSKILKTAHIRIVSMKNCRNIYGEKRITDQMMCAGTPEGGQGSCQGDSGGPFAVNGKLAGIVSWAIGCSRPNTPTVFTNLADFQDWVQDSIEELTKSQ